MYIYILLLHTFVKQMKPSNIKVRSAYNVFIEAHKCIHASFVSQTNVDHNRFSFACLFRTDCTWRSWWCFASPVNYIKSIFMLLKKHSYIKDILIPGLRKGRTYNFLFCFKSLAVFQTGKWQTESVRWNSLQTDFSI